MQQCFMNMNDNEKNVVPCVNEVKSFHKSTLQTSNYAMNIMNPEDLSLICPRIICSTTIINQSLLENVSPGVKNSEDAVDDAEFLNDLKNKIDKDHEIYPKENHYFLFNSTSSHTKRKKHPFNEESRNIIKRFKKSIEHKNYQNKSLTVSSAEVNMNKTDDDTGKEFISDSVTNNDKSNLKIKCVNSDTRNKIPRKIASMSYQYNLEINNEYLIYSVDKSPVNTDIKDLHNYGIELFTPPESND